MEKPSKMPAAVKTRQLAVELPDTGFRTVLFFNRWGSENIGGGRLLHFGFVTPAGDVLDVHSTVMSDLFIEANRQDWLDYLGKLGDVPQGAVDTAWRPPVARVKAVEFVTSIRLARSGPHAEIRLYAVSLVAIIDQQRGATSSVKPVPGQPLALLQSSVEQQQLLLLSLLKRD